MRLRDLAYLAGENIRPEVVDFLRSEGLDVRQVRQTVLAGSTDVSLLQLAYNEQRAVITHDGDFGGLAVLAEQPIVGIVYLRPGHIDPAFTIETFATLLRTDPDIVPPFIVVAHRAGDIVRIRVRQL